MNAKETYLNQEVNKQFKGFTTEGFQSLINEVVKDEIDFNLKKKVCKNFFIHCSRTLERMNTIEYCFDGLIYHIFDSSCENGWHVTTYPKDAVKDEDGEFDPDDAIDGGFCSGSAFDAITFLIDRKYL